MDKKSAARNSAAMYCRSDMKRSHSELALEELFKHTRSPSRDRDDFDSLPVDLSFPPRFPIQELLDGFSSCEVNKDTPVWSQNGTPKQSSISGTVDSQSSICDGSPISTSKPTHRDNITRATSGSSEQSDEDDAETEIGPCEQSTDLVDTKRINRMVSNRESARRSRRRKQAHLTDLETQVEHLRLENGTLFKQLADAIQEFKDATTNNRVLKSDVEALRAKVKLAEDLVARGSLTSSLSHLLQNYLSTNNSFSSNSNVSRVSISPTITTQGGSSPYTEAALAGQNSVLGLENVCPFGGGLNDGITNDVASGVSEIWP